jgi:lactoylglutathione lyase
MFKKLIAFGLRVKDFDMALDFYKNTLSLSVKTEDHENKFAELTVSGKTIALLSESSLSGMFDKKFLDTSDKSKVVLAVEVDSVEKSYEELISKGVSFIEKPKTTPWGQKVAYFQDSEGYIWELSEKFES